MKLSSVTSEVHGVSARIMLDALVAGERDPVVLADMAKSRLRNKIPQLTEALTGRFSEHHAFLVQIQLDLIDQRAKAIDEGHGPHRGGGGTFSSRARSDFNDPRNLDESG